MKYRLIVACILSASVATGQSWSGGSVVMKDESVLSGLLSLQRDQLVLFKTRDGKVTSLPAHRVNYFRYYDAKENVHRVFVSRQKNENGGQHHSFYETVLRGWVTVLRKPAMGLPSYSEKSEFNYFVEWNGTLVSLNQFRSRVYPQMMTFHVDSQPKHIRKLNPNKKAEALMIIAWYNENYKATSLAGL